MLTRLDLKKVKARYDPFKICPWGFKNPITEIEIQRAIWEQRFISPEIGKQTGSKKEHIERIAWFVAFGGSKSIKIAGFTQSSMQILNGNHRIRAAIVQPLDFLDAEIVCNDMVTIEMAGSLQ